MRIKLTALALAAVLPFAGAHAADTNQHDRNHWQKNDQRRLQALNLDERQRQQFEEKRQAHRAEQQKHHKEMQKRRLEQSDAHQRQMQAQRDRHHAELRNLLTPEQRMTFDRQQEKMQAGHNQRLEQHSKRGPMHKNMQQKHKQHARHDKQRMHDKKHGTKAYANRKLMNKGMHGGHGKQHQHSRNLR